MTIGTKMFAITVIKRRKHFFIGNRKIDLVSSSEIVNFALYLTDKTLLPNTCTTSLLIFNAVERLKKCFTSKLGKLNLASLQ